MSDHHDDHEPGSSPPPPPPDPSGISAVLAAAQFVVTGIVILGVAALMYMAGLNSGHGGGEGGKGPNPSQASAVDVQALLVTTPELVATGKSVFAINCASCHGTSGKGDGPAASALNPKPRDFSSGYWRYGGGVARVTQTITEGSPGTAMAPFPGIPIQDRFALAHYVRSFGTKQEADKPEDLAWLDQFGGPAKPADSLGAGTAGTMLAGTAPRIPIERAIELLTEPAAGGRTSAVPASAPDSSEGGQLYARRCASCHGGAGEGGVRTRMLGSAPYAYVTTRALGGPGASAGDPGRFERLVIHGLTGMMPGNGDLSSEQIRALYSYTQSLRARQDGVPRARS